MTQLALPLGCGGGYGRTPPGIHDYRGAAIKGRRWCVKLGCGQFEPTRKKVAASPSNTATPESRG